MRVSVADADPVVGTACLVDGRADVDSDGALESPLPPCGDAFALGPLADGDHHLTVAAFDSRANVAVVRRSFTVDTVAPTVTVSGIVDEAVYVVGQEMPSPGCAASDDASGLPGPCTGHVEVPEGGVGEHRYVASASDRAGNTSTVAVSWAVVYPFDGFFPPVANPPVLNAVNAGRSIPIKFSLSGDRGLAVLAAGGPSSESISCNDGDLVSELTETASAVAGALTCEADDDPYTYIWKTAKEWAGTCRLLRIDLVDGTTHVAVFGFR